MSAAAGARATNALLSSSSSTSSSNSGSSSERDRTWQTNHRRRQSEASMLDLEERLRQSPLRLHNRLHVNLLSEFFGTFLLLFVGTGSIMQHALGDKLNNYNQVCMAWGILIALCVFATYHTSGGHLNPAVSLAICTLGKMPWSYLGPYALAQMLGAFFGSALSAHLYADWLHDAKNVPDTARIFCSFPAGNVSNYTAFIDQVAGTALLLIFVCILIDPRNRVPAYLHPPGFGIAIFLICSSYGMNVASPINPARDFGPRLFLFIAGFENVFSYHNYYFWIPLFAPLLGAVIGTWLYQFAIGIHAPDAAEAEEQHTSKKKNTMLKNEEEEETNPLNGVLTS